MKNKLKVKKFGEKILKWKSFLHNRSFVAFNYYDSNKVDIKDNELGSKNVI